MRTLTLPKYLVCGHDGGGIAAKSWDQSMLIWQPSISGPILSRHVEHFEGTCTCVCLPFHVSLQCTRYCYELHFGEPPVVDTKRIW